MPKLESAVQRHDRMMREERDQAERVRSDRATPDIWTSSSKRFRPVATAIDPAVQPLAGLAGPDARVIDVGAGGGRITIPLAKRVREMVAIEPSPAMHKVLAAEIDRSAVANVTIMPVSWADAAVEPAELVFAAHVTYGIQRIEPFLRKLDRSATRHAGLVAFAAPPQHFVAPFWHAVYGEERLRLPCRDELLDVLRELGADPELIPLPEQESRSFGSQDEAFAELKRRLYIGDRPDLEARLRDAIADLTVERDGERWPRESLPNPLSVIWWPPAGM